VQWPFAGKEKAEIWEVAMSEFESLDRQARALREMSDPTWQL